LASIKDVERVADDLETLVGELRKELKDNPDFERLVAIADEISEHADNAAQTFSNVNDTLMSRLGEITGRKRSSSSGGSQSREKAQSSS
jgi:ABC-type transporter Mla subunit MlaD